MRELDDTDSKMFLGVLRLEPRVVAVEDWKIYPPSSDSETAQKRVRIAMTG